jgi:hypothetical protein
MFQIDMAPFEKMAANVGAMQDQVPFAISRALNKAVLNTENRLATETWPQHVTVRNRSFLKAALSPEFSDKRNLRVALVDKLGRAALQLHAKGGTKQATRNFAIPTKRVSRNAKGVVQSQKPGSLKNKVVKGGLIFQAVGRGKNKKLQLLYTLKPTTKVKADVPFYSEFGRFMREEAKREFPKAIAQAMRTRR